ncbi:hypothetical protein VaNZ11_003827 [Volvox africanus]|uniref:Guanylate cyclase domain-containing protein n=1 Tax=Volvox africanus TaxID=51714 RepID=A0ABQ5RWC0_9CHLO|nr:hypothetical protein VaNZ11_003827 [Volvox africanus]
MGIFSCCLCGDKPEKEDAEEVKHKIQAEPAETQVQKEATPAVQPSDDDRPPAPCTSTELSTPEEEQPLQLVARRLAKHLLERQPSKSKKLQGASFGGAVGQRWVSNLDGPTVDGPVYNGNTATGGLLLQEVKPLYDPVAGTSTSRLAGTYGSLTSQINSPHTGAGGHQSSSMNFARSVNRLSAINTSGGFSRRASLLDVDFTKASLQLALGSSLLRGSIAGGVSTHGAPPEPWMLQNILRQTSLPPPPAAAAAHPTPYLLPSGPLGGHTGFMPSSLPATASVMAAIAAGLGQNPSNAGRPSCDRDTSRSSYSQIHQHSPAATHGQHVLHPQHSSYPVPLFSRAVCERVENLPAPLVVLVLRSAAAAAGASDGGGVSGLGTGPSPALGHGEEGERSEAVGRRAASTGGSNLDIGDDCDGGVSWPVQTPGVPVVTSMKLDMPTLQQIEAKRHISHASHASRIVSGRQPSNPSQTSHPGDAEAEARQRAYACLVSALEEAAGRQVALVHAWHNAAAGALLTTAATIAAATARTGGVPTGGSDSLESQCDVSDEGVAALAAGALAEGGEVGVVLWGLRELFDQDPCLPLLARDLLRQAAIRPEHVPPLTHSLVPSAYSGLLAGRDRFSAAVMAVAGATTAGTGNRRIILGSSALQAAVNMGQVRVHVCVFQTASADKAASAMSMVDTMVSAGSAAASAPQAAWLPAVVLEWPQPVSSTPPMPVPPPPIAIGTSSAFNATALLSPMARASVPHSQHRSVFHDADRPQSSSFMTLEGPGPAAAVGLLASGAGGFPRQVPIEMPVAGSQLIVPNIMPSLSLGMASISSTVGPVAVESGPATANVTGGPFGSPASAAAMEEPTALTGGELAPLAGAELLYVIQTWQRHHLLLASVPYAITLFDCGGRVLQQNQGSVDFMGEITGDPMEQHQSIAAAAGAAAGGSAGLEQRTSATFGAKAAGAHTSGKSGLGSGPGGGTSVGFAGGMPLMDVSEVDVLSVLFCLSPDLLDEMLEEVICGNMWRGIVQVPRVMRPCIRAAQRWGAAGKAAVAQGSTVAAVATEAEGTASCLADRGAAAAPDIPKNSGGLAVGKTVKQPCASGSTPLEMNTETNAGPPAAHKPSGVPRNSHSGSSDSMELVTASNATCLGAGANEPLQHVRSFNSGRPSVNVASPLRRLATSMAVMGLKGPERLGGSSGGEGNGADANGSGGTGPQRLGPSRRPPARSYSLRGLIRPMVSSFSNQYASPSLRGGAPHRLALGDGSCGASAASTEQLVAAARAPETAAARTLEAAGTRAPEATATQVAKAEDAKVLEAAVVSPPARMPRRRPPTRVCERSSLGEPHFHSFTAGQARGLPSRQASEHMLMGGVQQQGLPYPGGGGTQGQQQPFNRGTLPMSPNFGAVGKPRSSVLAFAERLRSGRLPGVSSGGSSNSSSGSGTLPGARPAPRRLRSGLSLASGPDGPLPGSQGSPFTAHFGEPNADFALQTVEVEQSDISAATAGEQMKVDPQAGLATTAGTEAGLAVMVAATPGAVAAQPDAKSDGVAGLAGFPSASDLSQTAWEPESDGQVAREAELRSLKSGSGMDVWMGHSHNTGSATSPAADFTTFPPGCGSGGNQSVERGRLTPPQLRPAGVTPSPLLLSLADQRQIRMMSDPVAHPTLPQVTVIAEPRNHGTANSAADSIGDSLSAVMEATASPPTFKTAVKTAVMAELTATDGHAVPSANGASPLGGIRPAYSVPIKPLEADAACSTEDVVHSEYPAEPPPPAWGARNHSANGAGLQPGSGGHHARGSVRRQLHALKRPLSRSSTRTYLMTAIPTSTLNVLGRVHSMRQMEYEGEPDCERDATRGQEDRIGGGGLLLRASTTTAALGRRTRTATVYRSKSHSLNVTAAEPRMAVPRIFSFMRSASKRMLRQMQGQQVDATSCRSTGGEACSTAPIAISPQRRHTFELAPLNINGVSGNDTAGGGGGGYRLSHSPRWSVGCHPQRLTPVVSPVGLETAYEDSSMGPSGSNAAHMGEVPARSFSATSEGPLHKSSREQVTSPPRPLPASAIIGPGMPSSSSEDAGPGPAVAAAAAAAIASPSSVAGAERVSRGSAPPLMPPQLTRLRASEDWVDAGGVGVRIMSPREMSPADMARRVGMAWHEVAATSFTDPVTGARVVALVQNDVSEKVETEMQLTELMEVEHRLLEQIFPRHVLEHIAMQNISGAAAVQHSQGSGAGRKQRRMSQFDLLKSQDCSQLAHHHEQITVLFCDVKGFTAMCSSVEPAVVMSFLNMLYTQFDSLLHVHDVYKVETIGDCYMVAGGLVRQGSDGVAALLEFGEVDPDHARKVVRFAKDLLEVVRELHMPNGQPLQVRVGIHSGPAMSGVVGTKMPRFCLFGDTINTASRCESTCPPSSIHATTAVRDLVPEEPWVATGGVMAKGKGMMRTFLLGPTNPATTTPESADDGAVSDLCSSRPVGVGIGMGSGFLSPSSPPMHGTGGMVAAAAAATGIVTASGVGPDVAVAPIAAAAFGPAAPTSPAAANRHSALRRLGSGVRRNSSLRAITTTSAAVAAAAAAAASGGTGGLPNSVTLMPPGSIAAAAIAAAGGGGLGSSGPASPNARMASGTAVSSSAPPLAIATTSGYLRLPSTVLSSSPAETATSNALVRTFAPAGELPCIAPVVDPSRAITAAAAAAAAAAATATAIDPDGDCLPSAHDVRVVNIMTAGHRLLGGGNATGARVGVVGVGMSPQLHVTSQSHGGVSVFAAQTTRTELGPDFVSSSAIVPPSGLLFDSGAGVTTNEPVMQAGALPPIVYEVEHEHEPQDLGENLRTPLGSRAGGGGGGGSNSASASR